MSKLLSAAFFRLKKDKVFWIVTLSMFLLSVFIMVDNGMQAVKYPDPDAENNLAGLNFCYFNFMPAIGLFYAVFISLFIGTEYSDGAIRNKIVIGHNRADIYLSNFVVCFAGSLVIYTAYLLGGLVGIPFFGMWQNGIWNFFLFILLGIFMTSALTAVLTLLCMMSTNKAVTAVLSIVLCLFLMIAGSIIYNGLFEPETVREFISVSADGTVQYGDEIMNPAYVSGAQRKIYEFLLQFLPTGQGILMANDEITRPLLNLVYSVIITVLTNVCGVFLFRKKDLK